MSLFSGGSACPLGDEAVDGKNGKFLEEYDIVADLELLLAGHDVTELDGLLAGAAAEDNDDFEDDEEEHGTGEPKRDTPAGCGGAAVDLEALLAVLQLADAGRGYIVDARSAARVQIGKIRFFGKCGKADCTVAGHGKDCKLMLNKRAPTDLPRLLHSLYTWLGQGRDLDGAGHRAGAVVARERFAS